MKTKILIICVIVIGLMACPHLYTNKMAQDTELENVVDATHYVSNADWNGVQCRSYSEDDGYTNIQECIFPNANMQQVYDIVKRIDPNLKTELPTNSIEYPSTLHGCIIVKYEYKTKKHLRINLSYEGGETYIEIIEKGKNTVSKITYSAD